MNRRTILTAVALSMTAMLSTAAAPTGGGHGGPQGPHDYQLNIIGTGDKSADMTGDNGHRIFVSLDGRSDINLQEGEFAVLDANGTDRDGALFQLPAPGLDAYEVGSPGDADVESNYSVFIRPLGKPGGMATMTTCAELVDSEFAGLLGSRELKEIKNRVREDRDAYCSIEQVGHDVLTRKKGKSTFTNVTAELTTIVFELEVELEDGTIDTIQIRVPLFDDIIEGEFWEYDNKGLRLAQLRFYDCSTNVETGESTC